LVSHKVTVSVVEMRWLPKSVILMRIDNRSMDNDDMVNITANLEIGNGACKHAKTCLKTRYNAPSRPL
jgi:hypothetical protein